MISGCDKIIIAGFGDAEFAAAFFAAKLGRIRKNVFYFNRFTEHEKNQLEIFSHNSIAVMFALEASDDYTINMSNALHEMETPIIGITDGMTSVLANKCIEEFYIDWDNKKKFNNNYTVLISFIEAFCNDLFKKNEKNIELENNRLIVYKNIEEHTLSS